VTDEPTGPDFERLLEYIRESRGFDFGGYKRTTLVRRVTKRMTSVGVKDHAAYLEYLEAQPGEFAALFNTILINVTSYFRDASAWEYLQQDILPKIVANKERYEPIRVWSAGVASGQEAYSVAMLLCEALGASEYRQRAKIYATDVDDDALAQARQGRAEEKELEEIPAGLREKYFEAEGSHYLLRGDLRRSLIFGRHDLMQDAPISRVDLLICRNTLMYFESEAQARILARLHYALTEKGYLFLGKAEMLLRRSELFAPVDIKHRVFSKVPKETLRERLVVLAQAGSADPVNQVTRQGRVCRSLTWRSTRPGSSSPSMSGRARPLALPPPMSAGQSRISRFPTVRWTCVR
jgi:two-component system CheB/CheR fusion protein